MVRADLTQTTRTSPTRTGCHRVPDETRHGGHEATRFAGMLLPVIERVAKNQNKSTRGDRHKVRNQRGHDAAASVVVGAFSCTRAMTSEAKSRIRPVGV